MAGKRGAVFFDRDGVLNRDIGYPHRPDQIEWISGAAEAVLLANASGRLVFVVTNQSGVARGYFTEADVQALHRWMAAELAALGAVVDAWAYCPHHVEGTVGGYARACDCRKPAPGMIRKLMAEHDVDSARSLLIGDKPSDMEAAAAAGIRGVRFEGGDLREAVESALSA